MSSDLGSEGQEKGLENYMIVSNDSEDLFSETGAEKKKQDKPDLSGMMIPDDEMSPGGVAQNTTGEIPVFHFMTNQKRASELDNAIPIQYTVNKLIAYMMVTSEFSAFPQRWIITNATFQNGRCEIAPFKTTQIPPSEQGDQYNGNREAAIYTGRIHYPAKRQGYNGSDKYSFQSADETYDNGQ